MAHEPDDVYKDWDIFNQYMYILLPRNYDFVDFDNKNWTYVLGICYDDVQLYI